MYWMNHHPSELCQWQPLGITYKNANFCLLFSDRNKLQMIFDHHFLLYYQCNNPLMSQNGRTSPTRTSWSTSDINTSSVNSTKCFVLPLSVLHAGAGGWARLAALLFVIFSLLCALPCQYSMREQGVGPCLRCFLLPFPPCVIMAL